VVQGINTNIDKENLFGNNHQHRNDYPSNFSAPIWMRACVDSPQANHTSISSENDHPLPESVNTENNQSPQIR
jgi:hypothetical protein